MKRYAFPIVTGLLLLVALFHCPSHVDNKTEDKGLLGVTQVIDGSSLVLGDGRVIRLIGVNVPSMQDREQNLQTAEILGIDPSRCEVYMPEAKDYLVSIIAQKDVHTTIDPVNEILNHQDSSGRFLAYLYRGETFVNAEMIRQGYGVTQRTFQFRFRDEFLKLEKEARENRRGLWRIQEAAGPAEIQEVFKEIDKARDVTDQARR